MKSFTSGFVNISLTRMGARGLDLAFDLERRYFDLR